MVNNKGYGVLLPSVYYNAPVQYKDGVKYTFSIHDSYSQKNIEYCLIREDSYLSHNGEPFQFQNSNGFHNVIFFQSMRLSAPCWPIDPAVFAPESIFDRIMKANVVARLFILP